MKAEIQLLNAVLSNGDIQTVLNPDVARMIDSQDIYGTIIDYYHKYGRVPTFDIVRSNHGDFPRIDTSGDTAYYVDELRNEYVSREMHDIVSEIARSKNAPAHNLEKMIQRLNSLSRDSGVVKDINITDIEDAVHDFQERKKMSDERGGSPGIQTRIPYFDNAYPTGLAGGHLIVVIGWSGHGKSLFSSYLACRAWEQGFKPMIVSLEMSGEQVRDRIYTMLASGQFSNDDMSRGNVNLDDFQRWGTKNLEGRNDFIVISNEGMSEVTPLTVQSKIDQHRPDIVICDYQQLFSPSSGNRREVEANKEISRSFKRIAMSNNIPVVNLTQATQSDVSDLAEPPLIEQVAWSKSIQHDADLAVAVHLPPNSDTMEVIARKSRHGKLFLFWFQNLDVDRGLWTPTDKLEDYEDDDFVLD